MNDKKNRPHYEEEVIEKYAKIERINTIITVIAIFFSQSG